MSKIYILYDVGPQSRLEWITSAFSQKEIVWMEMNYDYKNRVYKWRKPLQFFSYLELALKAIYKSKPEDCIISWNFIIGALIAYICRLLHIKRNILSLNMISHRKGKTITMMRRVVYNYSFGYKDFYFTVNSAETLSDYLKEYSIDKDKVTVLPDPYLPIYKEKPYDPAAEYIFCGGEALRDWDTFFKTADSLPEFNFIGVARRKYMPKDIEIPNNVTMLYDIEENHFDSLLENASIVALPLLTSAAPAGLIVIIKSIFLSKPLIVTRSSSIQNYLENGKSAILIDAGDVEGLKEGIAKLKQNTQWSEQITLNARVNIEKFSPQNFSKSIKFILQNKMQINTYN